MNNIAQPKLDLPRHIRVLFYSSFVCMSAYVNLIFTTICECTRPINNRLSRVYCGSAVRFGPALPGLPCYCAQLVCVSVVIELLAVWRRNKPKSKKPTYHVPSSRTVSKRTPLEAPGTNSSRGDLLLTVLDEET